MAQRLEGGVPKFGLHSVFCAEVMTVIQGEQKKPKTNPKQNCCCVPFGRGRSCCSRQTFRRLSIRDDELFFLRRIEYTRIQEEAPSDVVAKD